MRFWRGIAAAAAGLALVLAPVLAQATGPGGTVSNVVAVWGQDTSTGLPCIVAPIGGSATCVLPTTSGGGGGGGGTSSNFAAAFPTAGTAAGFKSSSGSTMQPGNLDSGGNILVNCASGCAGGTASNASSGVATSSTNGTTNAWLYGFNGTTWDQVQVDASKYLKIDMTALNGAAPSITNPIWIANAEAADQTGTFTNATQTTSITNTNADGYATALLSINGTYATASGVFEESDDSGTTWYGIICTRSDGTASETGYTSLTNTNRQWSCPVAGNDSVRIRSTAVATGTVNGRVGISAPTNNSGVVSGSVNATLQAGSAKFGQAAIDQTTPGTTNGVQVLTGSTTAVTQATAANLNATVVGTGTFAVQASPTATATGGATPASILSANSTNATNVKNGAGTLYHISIQNTSTTALAYLIFFNTSTTPTCTGTPYYGPVAVPYVGSTGNNGSGVIEDFAVGLNFSTGISYCLTTAPAGTGSVAANAITGGLGYK